MSVLVVILMALVLGVVGFLAWVVVDGSRSFPDTGHASTAGPSIPQEGDKDSD